MAAKDVMCVVSKAMTKQPLFHATCGQRKQCAFYFKALVKAFKISHIDPEYILIWPFCNLDTLLHFMKIDIVARSIVET